MSEPTSGARSASTTSDALDDATAVQPRSATAAVAKEPEPLVVAGEGTGSTKATAAGTTAEAQRSRGPRPQRTRRARLRISRIDPWSAMKTSFLFAIAGGIIFWVATYLIWAAIGSSGLFDSINSMVASIVNAPGQQDQFQIQKYISTNKVLGFAAVLAFVDVVLLTILGTLGSFLYNLSATMLGGLEVTLAED